MQHAGNCASLRAPVACDAYVHKDSHAAVAQLRALPQTPPTAARVIRPHCSCAASQAHGTARSEITSRTRDTVGHRTHTPPRAFPAVRTDIPLIIVSGSNSLDLFFNVCLHRSCQHAVKRSDFYCPYITTGGDFSALLPQVLRDSFLKTAGA